MAADFIRVNQTVSQQARDLIQFVGLLRQAYEVGQRVRAIMFHNFESGANIDWSTLESLYGLTPGGTSVGPTATGAVVFTLVDGTIGAMEGTFQNSNGKDLTEKVG